MALNKTLPGLALLRVRSSTLDPKSTQIPFHTPQAFILPCNQHSAANHSKRFFFFSTVPQCSRHHSFSYKH